jgi:hypothetical protein
LPSGISLIAKTIESRDVNITNHAEKTDELCRVTVAKCNETIGRVELLMKNPGAQVDPQAIVRGVQNSIQSGIDQKIISPFMERTKELSREVMPTLEKIQDVADEAKTEWTRHIWKTAWTTSVFWSICSAVIIASLICLNFAAYYEHKMTAQVADMAPVMKFDQEAFRQLAIAQAPIQVFPTQNDGFGSPPGFVLVIEGAYAADMQQVNGQNAGCIFFNSSVPAKQIQHLQRDIGNQAPATNSPAK